jgi:hypothetical protein
MEDTENNEKKSRVFRVQIKSSPKEVLNKILVLGNGFVLAFDGRGLESDCVMLAMFISLSTDFQLTPV